MATAVKTMSNLAIVINILLKMQADGLIQLLWIKERFFSVSTQWIGRVNNLSVVAATVDQHNSSVTDQFGMYHAFIVCASCYSVFHLLAICTQVNGHGNVQATSRLSSTFCYRCKQTAWFNWCESKIAFFSVSTQWIGRVNNLSVVAATVDQHNSSVTDQFGMYHAFIVCASCYSVFHLLAICTQVNGHGNVQATSRLSSTFCYRCKQTAWFNWCESKSAFFCLNPVEGVSK